LKVNNNGQHKKQNIKKKLKQQRELIHNLLNEINDSYSLLNNVKHSKNQLCDEVKSLHQQLIDQRLSQAQQINFMTHQLLENEKKHELAIKEQKEFLNRYIHTNKYINCSNNDTHNLHYNHYNPDYLLNDNSIINNSSQSTINIEEIYETLRKQNNHIHKLKISNLQN